MLCPTCRRPMTPLFTGAACDFCDGKIEGSYLGFIVMKSGQTLPYTDYVFPTRIDADRWRELNLPNIPAYADAHVLQVQSANPFHWSHSRGTIRGVLIAEGLFEIYPDENYTPRPGRCSLVNRWA